MSKGKQVEKFTPVEQEDEEEDNLAINFADLPSVVQRRVLALKKLHGEHLALEKKYREEVLALEHKYQDLYAPLFLKRATVVSGEHEPSDEEARFNDEEPPKADDKDKDTKGIPEFWLAVMKNNPIVGDTITEKDVEALKFLRDIRYTRLDGDKPGFKLSFHFAENPFFTNKELTKIYHLADDDNLFGELVFDHAEGCDIKWQPGKNLTVKIVKKQQKSRPQRGGKGKGGGGAGRVTTVEEPCDSFFLFFTPPAPPSEEVEEDEEGLLDDMLEADFETGVIFKDKLIPHAALWFTGEALAFEDTYDDDEFYNEFGDDEDDEDEDEDDEDEDDEEDMRPPPKKGGGARPGPGPKKGGAPQLPPPAAKGAPGQPQQPECKQQ